MAGDIVDALTSRAMSTLIDVRAADDSLVKLPNRVRVGFQKTFDIVAKGTIPFLPLVMAEASYLV